MGRCILGTTLALAQMCAMNTLGAVSKALGDEWKQKIVNDDEQRAPFDAKAKAAKEKYQADKKDYGRRYKQWSDERKKRKREDDQKGGRADGCPSPCSADPS